MEILFIDESNPPTDKDKLNSTNSIFVLSGLVISDSEWKGVNAAFKNILEQYKVKGEIKWRFFSPHNKDPKNSLLHLEKESKNLLRIDLLKMLGTHPDIKVISVICKLKEAYETYYIKTKTDAYDFCYKKLVERFQYYLQDKSKKTNKEEVGIIVCDHRGRQDDIHLRQMHEKICARTEAFCSDISNIIETVFFVPSEKSTGIQLVDLIAGSIFRRVSANDSSFYQHIRSIVRRITAGEAKGFGIVFVPQEQKKTPS